MTLKEAIETDHSVYVNRIKRYMSVKDSEYLDDLITTLKKYAKILDESEWLIEDVNCCDCGNRIGEECGLGGHEIYPDTMACDNFIEK